MLEEEDEDDEDGNRKNMKKRGDKWQRIRRLQSTVVTL
jgi:hypothetical protein